MLLKKRDYRLVHRVIESWEKESVVDAEESKRLKDSLVLSRFDFKRLAVYSFWIAGISIAISVFAIIFDEVILDLIMKFLEIPDGLKSALFAVLSAAMYVLGFRRKTTKPGKKFSNEFLLFLGAILSGVAIAFFGMAVDTGSGHFSLLILLASLVYLGVGAFFPSAPMWVLGIVSLGSWFGTETGYASGWGEYFLGMNYPLRFVVFGAGLVGLSFIMRQSRFLRLRASTFTMGLLNLFIALWILSIWGNYGDMDSWHESPFLGRFLWSLLFGAAAIGAIIWGLKNDNAVSRGFGLTFLFINLYTKYFEYFWEVSHKALFFGILGVSFWFVGRYAERAYNAFKDKLLEAPEGE